MDEATIEDLAFVVRPSREVDETWRGNSFAFPLPTGVLLRSDSLPPLLGKV